MFLSPQLEQYLYLVLTNVLKPKNVSKTHFRLDSSEFHYAGIIPVGSSFLTPSSMPGYFPGDTREYEKLYPPICMNVNDFPH